MGFFSKEFNTLKEVFIHELSDMMDAETRLSEALPTMAEAAHAPELKQAFNDHLQQTHTHINRLTDVFARLGCEPQSETCAGMKGLISEGSDIANADGDAAVRDAALICAAQKVEHYEIAGYGTLRTWADYLGMHEVAQILQTTLDEEGEADKKLTSLAQRSINEMASH